MDAQTARDAAPFVPTWTIGDRFRKARDIAGDTQEAFAHKLGVNPSTYSAWEAGRSNPRFGHAVELAWQIQDLTGVDAQWIIGTDRPRGPERRTLDYRGAVSEGGATIHHLADYRKPEVV